MQITKWKTSRRLLAIGHATDRYAPTEIVREEYCPIGVKHDDTWSWHQGGEKKVSWKHNCPVWYLVIVVPYLFSCVIFRVFVFQTLVGHLAMITSLATSLHYSILVSAAKVSERCAPAEIVTRIVLDSQERVNHIPQGGGGGLLPCTPPHIF